MQRPAAAPAAAALAALLLVPACSEPLVRGDHAPVVAGVAQQRGSALTDRLRGLALLDELGCTACHVLDGADPRPGPDLVTAATRIRADHLRAFVADPLAVEPGTTMPDTLRDLDRSARDGAVNALAAYLESRNPGGRPALAAIADPEAATRGAELWRSIGCVQCHRADDGDHDLQHVADKYRPGALAAFLLAPHTARPGGRMPDFGLAPAEAVDLAAFLAPTAGAAPADPVAPAADLVAAGRTLFAERGCAACHDVADADRPQRRDAGTLQQIAAAGSGSAPAPGRGCLSGEAGPWPYYALTAAQRAEIGAALTAIGEPLDAADRVHIALTSRRCTACHERRIDWTIATPDEPDAAAMASNLDTHDSSFLTNDPTIGQEGRLPPPLTGVGAKLQAEWLAATIAHGQEERPYLQTRMPGFGEAFGQRLATLLAATDGLPPVTVSPLPQDREQKKVVINVGKELTGDQGMNCIACHHFAGEQAGSMAAIDLVATTGRRLRPEWFAHFLRSPFTYKPNTLMPQFFPDGKSTRPEIADGDLQRQIDGLWHYLAAGRNVGAPRGLRRPPIVLQVHDEAVMLRRALHHTGKRGIAVGYPGGVNLAFDAETLGLDQIWWGEFLDAGPVWRSQGHGRAHPRGRPRFTLPKGPAFVELKEPGAPWPEQSRRQLGQQWLGYDLDERRRPAFRYEAAGVEIVDAPRERVTGEEERPLLERRLRFTSPKAARLTFLAARDADIEAVGDRFRIGQDLAITIAGAEGTVHEAGEQLQLRVTIDVPTDGCEVVLTYEPWQ